MNKILETERLLLREFIISDAKNMWKLNSDSEVIKYTGDKSFESIEEAKIFLENYSDYKTNNYGRWAVIEKKSNNFIGWCGLKLNEENFVDVGFRYFREEWGKGFATESALACLNYGFIKLELNEIIGRAETENKSSIRVLEKLNMNFWKTDSSKGIKELIYYKIDKTQYLTLNSSL